jgi:rhomboid protease GluP
VADPETPPPPADPPPKEAEVTPYFATPPEGRASPRVEMPEWFNKNPPWPVGAEPRIPFGQALHLATPRIRSTWLLLAANVAVFFWMVTMRGVDARDPTPEQLLANGADSAFLVLAKGQWWRLFTSTFVHVGVLHLAMNMYGLYALGPFVERLYGNLGFAAIWLVAGLVGSLASIVMHPEVAASAGASGSLFGVLGALAAYLLRQRRTIPRGVFGSLMRSVLLMVVLNVWLGMSVPNIDMAAHGGGAGAGFLAGFAIARPLTPQGVAGRGVRALLVSVAGVVACVGVLIARSR